MSAHKRNGTVRNFLTMPVTARLYIGVGDIEACRSIQLPHIPPAGLYVVIKPKSRHLDDPLKLCIQFCEYNFEERVFECFCTIDSRLAADEMDVYSDLSEYGFKQVRQYGIGTPGSSCQSSVISCQLGAPTNPHPDDASGVNHKD